MRRNYMKKQRIIFHIDLDCFYASVEMNENPQLKKKCVAVCGDVEKRHGIILSKSYAAKAAGVKTGEAVWQAKSKCPDLILVQAKFDSYLRYSEMVRRIYDRYTDKIEPFGLDECWLDVTGSCFYLQLSPLAMAYKIQAEIKSETGLDASIGIGWNKIIAKFGSDKGKPFGITYIHEDNYKDLFWQAPVEELLYVGRATKKKFNNFGIFTIGELAEDRYQQVEKYGGKIGRMLVEWARGNDDTPVSSPYETQEPCKSVGNSITTPQDIRNSEELISVLLVLSESVATRLKRLGMNGSVISVYLRDSKLQCAQQQRKIKQTNIAREVCAVASELALNLWDQQIPLRSVGVSVSDLEEEKSAIQLDLFDDYSIREEEKELDKTIDKIREKYGFDKIGRLIVYKNRGLTNFNPLSHTIHPVSYFK